VIGRLVINQLAIRDWTNRKLFNQAIREWATRGTTTEIEWSGFFGPITMDPDSMVIKPVIKETQKLQYLFLIFISLPIIAK